MPRILALETSTQRGGAAVVIDGRIAAEFFTDRQRSHSELLNIFVQQALDEAKLKFADIDVFAVGRGPGSFTGIRVASNAGRAFASVFQKPLITVDSLAQIADSARDRSRPVLVMINAFKNMVYYGVFDVSGDEPVARGEYGAASVAEIEPLITETMTVAGDGFTVYADDFSPAARARLVRENVPVDFPSPGRLAMMAHSLALQGRVLRWNEFTPLYLRASEAEEKRRGALFKSHDVKDPIDGKTR